MVDTRDLKSLGPKRPYGFESHPRHINTLSSSLEGVLFVTVMMQKTVGDGRREEGRFLLPPQRRAVAAELRNARRSVKWKWLEISNLRKSACVKWHKRFCVNSC